AERRRLVLVDTDRIRRTPRQAKCLPDVFARQVLAHRPGDFAACHFARDDARGGNIVGDIGGLTHSHLPGKFTEYVRSASFRSLKMPIGLAKVFHLRRAGIGKDLRQSFQNADIVPVSVVFGEIAESFVGIEEHVLVPTIGDAVDMNGAPLEADRLVINAANFSACSQRNERLVFVGGNFESLQDLQIGIFGVKDGMAAFTDNRNGSVEGADEKGSPAIGTVERLHLRLYSRGPRAHDQPSKARRFLRARSSNSTISPRYSTGFSSL